MKNVFVNRRPAFRNVGIGSLLLEGKTWVEQHADRRLRSRKGVRMITNSNLFTAYSYQLKAFGGKLTFH